jgi:hypothetical protein
MNENNKITTCHCCGAEIEVTESTPTFDGEYFCDMECFDNEVIKCSKCGKLVWEDDSVDCDGDDLCEDCAEDFTFVCDHCEERTYTSEMVSDGSIDLCQHCYREHYYRCNECECIIHADNTWWEDDDPYCRDCYDDCVGNGDILNYSFKPTPIMYRVGDLDSSRYFGVELEVDNGGEDDYNARKLLEIGNEDKTHIYIKSDGSLDEGFEIVSHPMTLAYHQQFCWEDIMRKAVNLDYLSHQTDTCGLHVHVNRDSLGSTEEQRDATIAKILYFIEIHWNEIVRFTRRNMSNLTRWANRYGYEQDSKKLLDKAKGSYNRYTAVNLNNRNTIEFRVFRGTLKYNTFIATLQFVNRVCDFALYNSESLIAETSWSEFVASIKEPELIQYLKERKLYINETTTESEEI